MAVENPTAANVSLWARFFKEEWGVDAAPSNRYLSRAAAAAVSGWLTFAVAPRIGRLYRENAPYVNGFGFNAQEPAPADDTPVPPELRRSDPQPERETSSAELRREASPPERRRHYERRSSSRPGTSSASTNKRETTTITH